MLAERLAFAGLVELRLAGPWSGWRVPAERLSETTIAITPLANQLLESLAEMHGFKVAPVGELADLDAAALLAELASWAGDIAEAELDAWIAARGDAAAGAELTAVLPEADALTRQRGFAALWSVGAAAEPSVRALAEHTELRPPAIAWLIERGLASPEELSADEAAGGVVDALAAALIGGSCGDDLAEVLLTGSGDRNHALAQIEELWRGDTPTPGRVHQAVVLKVATTPAPRGGRSAGSRSRTPTRAGEARPPVEGELCDETLSTAVPLRLASGGGFRLTVVGCPGCKKGA